MGHCYLSVEDFESCEKCYQRAFELDENCLDYIKDYIFILYCNDKPAEAIRLARQKMEEWQQHPELLALFAGIMYESGNFSLGDNYLKTALEGDNEAHITLLAISGNWKKTNTSSRLYSLINLTNFAP